MLTTTRENAAWFELTRIARVELMLDKIEEMLINLDIQRGNWLWMVWEHLSEQNGAALEQWVSSTFPVSKPAESHWTSDAYNPYEDGQPG